MASSARIGARQGRALVGGCLFVLFCGAGAFWWIGSSDRAERESTAATEDAPAVESQRREAVERLIATIAAQARDGPTVVESQAPPPRQDPSRQSVPLAGEAERPPAPDGYAYPSFEPGGPPRKSEGPGAAAPLSDAPEWLGSPDSLAVLSANAEAAGRDWSFGWVRLRADAARDEAVAALTQLGVRIEGQLGASFRARLPGDSERLRAIAALPDVAAVGAPPPSAKLPASFAKEARAMPAHEVVPVFVTLAAAGDPDALWREELERRGAVVGAYDPDTRTYLANVAYGVLDAIAAADFVAFVEPVGIVEANNDTAVPAMGADAYRTYTDADGWGGTAGESVAVAVMDTGLNINHLDIASGRHSVCGANFYTSLSEEQDLWVDANGHGTHVTGTVAGNGAAERRYAGMAPAARHIRFAKVLSSRGFGSDIAIFGGMDFLAEPSACDAAGWTDDAVKPLLVNMSLSWTALRWDGRQTAARKLDAVVWNARQLYVVANSNASVRGFSNYAAAKTSLSVGAAWDSGELAGFSSHGPTADGRLAPLIVGTGVNVASAWGGGTRGGYLSISGTSMSSPAVAGVAALAMDAQPELRWRPALARAHLMASAIKPDAWLDGANAFPADNTDGPGPLHDRFGLGKVSAATVVFDRRRRDGWQSGGRYDVRLEENEYETVGISVPDGASRLDVVLTWDEPPADVIENTVLNDLDLWLDEGADCDGARCGEWSSRSRRDNVEWIIVRNPQPGRWRAKIVAERVYSDRPRAALAYTVIRGPSTPQLSIVADRDTLDLGGGIELTISTDGYVAAGARLAMDCRTADGDPCHVWGATYEELRDDASPGARGDLRVGRFVTLGEIQSGRSRTVRVRGLRVSGDARVHFTVTGWNAAADATVVFVGEPPPNGASQRPDNDDFANAANLEDAVEGDLLLATTEPGEPPFARGTMRPAASVWYRWTADADGPVHFTVAPDPAFSGSTTIRVDLYRGENVAALRPVASAPWGASFLAEQGTEYVIRVAADTRGAPFTLSWREGGAPGHDAFDAPVVLDGVEGQVKGTNAGATLDPGESFGPFAATVWYAWTAPADGWHAFRSSASHLKVLAFEDGASAGDLRLVAGLPAAGIRFLARGGAAYRIAVASPDAEVAGTDFELSWSPAEEGSTSNDLLENAQALPGYDSSSSYVSLNDTTTVEPGEPAGSGVRTAWWSWTAPESGQYTWRLKSDRLTVAAFRGDRLTNLEFVGSNGGATGEFSFSADAGEPYRFAAGAAPGGTVFTWSRAGGSLVWGPTPANDTWSRAGQLVAASGTLRISNRFATTGRDERIWDVGHSSLWWSFEAPAAGWYRFWIEDPDLPFTLSAWRTGDARRPLEMIASSERGLGEGIAVLVRAREAGARIAVRVGTLGDAEGREFTLRWAESDGPVWLRYVRRTAERYHYDYEGGVDVADFSALAVGGEGRAVYAASPEGVAVFDRAVDDGSLEFATLWPIDRDDEQGDVGAPHLFWDAPRNRLLAFDGCSVRAYTPADADADGRVTPEDVLVAGDAQCAYGDRRAFSDPTGSFLYLLARRSRLQAFSFDEDGGLTHVQTMADGGMADAVPDAGGYVYVASRNALQVWKREDTGALTQVASVRLSPYTLEAVAVNHAGDRAFAWGGEVAVVADVGDPTRPARLDTLGETPRKFSWSTPRCRFAVGRGGARAAADAFCSDGGAHALEWRSEGLALADLVAQWAPNRYNDAVPDYGTPRGLAATRDGRHAYVSTPDRGILVFERVNNVADDHGDTRDAATAVPDPLPWSGKGALNWHGDRDVFRIEVDRPGTLTVYTRGDTDTFGTLADGTGAVLVEDDDGAAPNFEIEAALDGGTYYVEVRAADDAATGPYTLSVEFVADPSRVAFAGERVLAADGSPRWIHAADLDGDGAPDVLTAVSGEDEVSWYRNLGGGRLSSQRLIATDASGPVSVHAADLDGDGDADVLSASSGDDRIAWYENLGGGAFSAERLVATDADGAHSVHAADLDGDGDADVLSASTEDDRIAWYENLGGGAFAKPHLIATDVESAFSVHAADLDGDGDADVLSGSASEIAWSENVGGAFGRRRVITTDVDAVSVLHAADLDGDGDADVLSASRDDDRIAWYENRGGGAFSGQRVITTEADGAVAVHAADLDGDGDGDVLSASTGDGRIAWYDNLGRRVFAERNVIAAVAGAGPMAVHAADLDGDGDPDVLSESARGGGLAWHENLSDHGDDHGNAAAGATLATALPAFLHGTLESAGDHDVFRVATGAGTLRVRSNGPTDTYGVLLDADGRELAADHDSGAGSNFAVEVEVEAGVHYVAVAGDGSRADTGPYTLSVEFVAAGPDPGTGDDHGDDAETATAVVSLPWSAEGALEARGDRDVFRIDLSGSGTLTVRTSGRTDTFGTLTDADGAVLAEDDDSGTGTNFEIEAAVWGGVHYVEVRGFGNAAGPYTLTIEFVADGPAGAIGPQNVLTTLANGARSVRAADLDGDAAPDVLSASPHDDKIAWHRNLGGGAFSGQRVITTATDGAVWVHAADLDGDGDADVLSASDFDSKIAWYENLGGGNFSSQHVITDIAAGAVSVHAADLDGDGDADVLSASHRDDTIAWYENTGGGAFGPRVVIAAGLDGAYSVHAGDLDGDGDADVLSASFEGDRIAWHENLGSGTFAARRDIVAGADGAASVHAADLDGDGDLDVLAACFEGNEVAWHENTGSGAFTARSVVQAANSPWTVHAVDLDGDRDLDVVAASGHGDGVALFENVGGGALAAERMITASARFARSVYAADLDGDGDADLLSASEHDSKIAWYENTSDHGDDHADALSDATLAPVLPTFLHGVVEAIGDRDVFRVTTGAGTLRAYSGGPTDTYGRLMDAGGNVLSQNDDGGSGVNFDVATEVAPGVYFVVVQGYNQTGPYTLIVEFVADASGSP